MGAAAGRVRRKEGPHGRRAHKRLSSSCRQVDLESVDLPSESPPALPSPLSPLLPPATSAELEEMWHVLLVLLGTRPTANDWFRVRVSDRGSNESPAQIWPRLGSRRFGALSVRVELRAASGIVACPRSIAIVIKK